MSKEWEDYWRGLRARRLVVAVVSVSSLAAWIFLGAPGLALGFIAIVVAYWRLRAWPCPRCQQPIVGAGFRTFAERCASCGLKVFGHVADVEQRPAIAPNATALSDNVRRFIAGYEILAGVCLMVLSAFGTGPWWRLVMLEGLAGMSIAAGVWLRQDDARGYALTRTLQGVQLLQFQSPWLTYVAASGATFELAHANGNVNFGPGFNSKFVLLWMPEQPFGIAVNLWAALLLLVLLHAKPRAPESGSASDAAPSIAPTVA